MHFNSRTIVNLLITFLQISLLIIPKFSISGPICVSNNSPNDNVNSTVNSNLSNIEKDDHNNTINTVKKKMSLSEVGREFNLRNRRENAGVLLEEEVPKSNSSNSGAGVEDLIVNTTDRTLSSSDTNVTSLRILGLFELTENGSRRASGVSEKFAAQLALDDINRRGILNQYKLIMHTNDTQCDAGVGVDAFFHALYTNKKTKIISLLGSACSEVTERLAKIVPYWNVVQVSFGSTSPSLSDRTEFPLFYRTVSTVSSHNKAIVALIQHFHWDTVTFFTINENQFTMPANYLVTELGKANVTSKAAFTFSMSDLQDQLQDMKEMDARIIIASFGSDVAPRIFCEVYKMGMYGGDYAWIFMGKPEMSWWLPSFTFPSSENSTSKNTSEDPTTHRLNQLFSQVNCTHQQLRMSVENTLFIDRHNFIIRDMSSISGMNASQFREKFHKENLPESPYAPETYDAVWSIALALHNLLNRNYDLESFEYNNTNFSANFMTEMSNLVFTGISGPVSFSGADRIGVTSFSQIQDGKMMTVGLYFPRKSLLELNCSGCHPIRWPENQVPIARREFRFKIIRVETSLYFIVASVASGGIIMALAFLAFNLYNRKLKYIKLSSPRLNNMVIVGCICAYVAVILLGSEFGPEPDNKHFAYICFTRAYLLSAGFSLAFGAMFAKTYRVHRIFTRSCTGVVKNKLLRDRQLMILILALLGFDCVIVTSWAVFDPMRRTLKNLTLENDPEDRAIVYQTQIEVCRSLQGHVWLVVLYGYKSLLLMVGLYMAWETRHVKIQVLNDSKYIGLCVYIVVLTSVLAGSLANLISERVTLCFMTVTALILTSTTITLCLLFLPKIHAIVKRTNLGNPVVASMGLKIQFNTRRFMVEDTKELLFRAEVQNRVYKRQIQTIEAEIWRLEGLLISDLKPNMKSCLGNQMDKSNPSQMHDDVPFHISGTSPENSSEETGSPSDIYTVYLRGPRFIIPLSLVNLRRNSETPLTMGSVAAMAASALAAPRRSVPTMQNPTLVPPPTNGLLTKMYRIKSEPKLAHEIIEEGKPSFDNHPTPGPFASSESCASSSACQMDDSSRKSSTGSTGGSTLYSLLKYPINYVTGFLRPTTTMSSSSTNYSDHINKSSSNRNPCLNKGKVYPRQKFSSVPNLWGVKGGSPIIESRKKTCVFSDPMLDGGDGSPSFIPISEQNSFTEEDQGLLKLIETSTESPYL